MKTVAGWPVSWPHGCIQNKQFSVMGRVVSASLIALLALPVQAKPNHSIAGLPDGDYVYGEAPILNDPNAGYFVFRKTGDRVTGVFHQAANALQFCFQGKAVGSSLFNSADGPIKQQKEVSPLSQASDLGGLYQLRLDRLPASLKQDFQACLQPEKL